MPSPLGSGSLGEEVPLPFFKEGCSHADRIGQGIGGYTQGGGTLAWLIGRKEWGCEAHLSPKDSSWGG